MNIIEAVEQLKAGKAIQRSNWGNAKIQAVQLENGQYQIFASGDLTPEMLVLLSGDYDVKEEKETNDVERNGGSSVIQGIITVAISVLSATPAFWVLAHEQFYLECKNRTAVRRLWNTVYRHCCVTGCYTAITSTLMQDLHRFTQKKTTKEICTGSIHELGGNGVMTHLHEEFMALPTEKGKM